MKIFKGIVTNKATKDKKVMEIEARTKKEALLQIRGNGYSISDQRLKEKDVWDWIVFDNEDLTELEHEAIWYFNEIPKTNNEFDEKLNFFCGKAYLAKQNRKR